VLESQREAAAFNEIPELSHPWFLIHSQPCREHAVISKLKAFQVETFLPLTPHQRANKQHCPLFPSYVFAAFPYEFHRDVNDSLSRLPLLGRVVYFGNQPAQVPQEVIAAMRERADGRGMIGAVDHRATAAFNHGDKVGVVAGPLKGFEGVFDCALSSHDRVRILLDTVTFGNGWHGQHRGGAMNIEVSKRDLMLL
jgi:transcription antitermination factor NusG